MSTLAIWSHVVQSRDVRSRDFSRPKRKLKTQLLVQFDEDQKGFLDATEL